MLAKEARLNLKYDFNKVISGKKIDSSLLKIYYILSQSEKPLVGISVSGKIFKEANKRNRAKRLISRGFETLYNRLIPGLKIIVMPREAVLAIKTEELTKVLEKTLRENKLLT